MKAGQRADLCGLRPRPRRFAVSAVSRRAAGPNASSFLGNVALLIGCRGLSRSSYGGRSAVNSGNCRRDRGNVPRWPLLADDQWYQPVAARALSVL